jgi:hypothetical protein
MPVGKSIGERGSRPDGEVRTEKVLVFLREGSGDSRGEIAGRSCYSMNLRYGSPFPQLSRLGRSPPWARNIGGQ